MTVPDEWQYVNNVTPNLSKLASPLLCVYADLLSMRRREEEKRRFLRRRSFIPKAHAPLPETFFPRACQDKPSPTRMEASQPTRRGRRRAPPVDYFYFAFLYRRFEISSSAWWFSVELEQSRKALAQFSYMNMIRERSFTERRALTSKKKTKEKLI